MDLTKQKIDWPDYLGEPKRQNGLIGMGLGRAFDVEFQKLPAIVKVSPSEKERRFYEYLAPQLNEMGVDTPKLLWATTISDHHLMVLEKIEILLPESRWRADEEVLRFLANMHELEVPPTEMELRPDQWTQQMNINAKPFFKPEDQEFIFDMFESFREKHQYLFEPSHIISGDPSGRNWGVRENGNLVLFDWERVGLGTCALDLMGVAFGEPSDETFVEIARLYLKSRPTLKISAQDLARDTQVARVHISAVVLNTHAEGMGHLPEKVLTYFREQFPGWLHKTFLN